jgi:4-amino-4-deoxy-L-arabinose transferase-like glycosyltransferase
MGSNPAQPNSPDAARSRHQLLWAAAMAALAVLVRLPFLISGKIAFDSDEAVEGLMARHVLHGEFPVFFWGQTFKGVPEVYLSAAAFAAFGSSVVVLKAVTLVLFAIFIAINVVLLDKIAGRWTAVAASLLLILSPPALVFWSLDASAEYVLLMLLGAMFLLALGRWQERDGRLILATIGLVIGVALWVQQVFVFYLVPAGIIVVSNAAAKRIERRHLTPVAYMLATIAALYLALALVAFLTGGFSIGIRGVVLSARAPQKLLEIGALVGLLAMLAQVFATTSREAIRDRFHRSWPLVLGFVVGYFPALAYSMLVQPARAPTRSANLGKLVEAAPNILGNVIPILSGFKIATTERLPIPLVAAVPIAATLLAYVWLNRRRLIAFARMRAAPAMVATEFFPLFVVLVPLIFLMSGAYLDTQSYRYLIPWYVGLSVACATGCLALALGNRLIATSLLGTILAVQGSQQLLWYRKLTPDVASRATVDCLKRNGVRGGFADYWTSYKLTFLSNEDLIIAPENGVDRYPAYTEFVRSLPPAERAHLDNAGDACR